MRIDSLKQYVKLRSELNAERERLQSRLQSINEALGEMPLPSVSAIQGATSLAPSQPARRGRRAAGAGQSLREHVLSVLQGGAMTKEEVLAAIQKRGYKFTTKNPLNSLGVVLYGKNPKFNRVDGKFSLIGTANSQGAASNGATTSKPAGRRKMSVEARERIAAAQRARWAKQNDGKAEGPASNGSKRKMSAAGRKTIADSARKRWAGGKSRL